MKNSETNGDDISAIEPIYVEMGERDHVDTGPQIGPDGRYDRPVDVDTHNYICPTCNKPWPEAPDIFLIREEKIVWIEGVAIPVKRHLQISFWETLIERFGKFIPREDWIDISCSTVPDSDVPDQNSMNHIIAQIRKSLKPTNLVLQTHSRLGYRLTTKQVASSLKENERRAVIREKEALNKSRVAHQLAMDRRRAAVKQRKRIDNKIKWRLSPKNARNKVRTKKSGS